MLPDGDGADVCAGLRDWLTAPIWLISAIQDEPDKIRALDPPSLVWGHSTRLIETLTGVGYRLRDADAVPTE
jgi:DNA-binding response OmpR family regulator